MQIIKQKPIMIGMSIVVVVLSMAAPLLHAQTCRTGQIKVCIDSTCFCAPDLSGDIETMASGMMTTLMQARAGVLEAWLLSSRNEFIASAMPMPPDIRKALTGFINEDVLEQARFKISDTSSINLADLAIDYGDLLIGNSVAAITLIDVIVFRNAEDAYQDPALWAHELAHVAQFLTWGTAEFSRLYVADSKNVEAQANLVGVEFLDWQQTHEPSH